MNPATTRWRRSARVLRALGTGLFVSCATDRTRSPTCGLAQVVGPTLIQQQLINAASVVGEAPRGLPGSLPARVVGQPDQGDVLVAYSDNGHELIMGYRGASFPTPPGGYALLVVDDSTERAQGVLLYESDVPRNAAVLGSVTGGDHSVPLLGVRVAWAGVSNPRCPLLGMPAAER